MVSCFGIDSYFNHWQTKISDIEMMNSGFISSGPFVSIVGSNVLVITNIQVEVKTSIQHQHLYMY